MSAIFKQSAKMANASDYAYIVEVGSRVEAWKPRQSRPIYAHLDAPRDEFGRPKKAPEGLEPRDRDGNVIPATHELVVKKGGDLENVVNFLLERLGSPLWLQNGDEGDAEREQLASAKFLRFKFEESTTIKDRWLQKVRAIRDQGGSVPAMPQVEFEADQFLVRYGSMGNLNMKRFLVEEDGSSWHYEEDAKAHLLHPARWPQFKDEWQKHIKDTQPELEKPVKSSNVEPPVNMYAYSASTISMIEEAAEAKIVFDDDLLDRLDKGDRGALRECLEILANAPDLDATAPELTPIQKARAAKAARAAAAKAASVPA